MPFSFKSHKNDILTAHDISKCSKDVEEKVVYQVHLEPAVMVQVRRYEYSECLK